LNRALQTFPGQQVNILEMGFGTGLNAFLTANATLTSPVPIRYWALEAFPLEMSLAVALNYPEQLGHEDLFNNIQLAPWNAQAPIHENFILRKEAVDLLSYKTADRFHLVYFDAFAPEVQPELWTEAVFRQLATLMYERAILVTYCSKGSVRRAMKAAGLQVEKIPGPPGKREMVRARKP
jgi:tRNA U34 5-methylaminomethyl-2-thiouridine-forming methyltransferase MnmC